MLRSFFPSKMIYQLFTSDSKMSKDGNISGYLQNMMPVLALKNPAKKCQTVTDILLQKLVHTMNVNPWHIEDDCKMTFR